MSDWIQRGDQLTLPTPERDRSGGAALLLLTALDYSVEQHTVRDLGDHVVAHTFTARTPITGGQALVWHAAASLLGQGATVNLWDVGMHLDREHRARFVQALAKAYDVELTPPNPLDDPRVRVSGSSVPDKHTASEAQED